MPISLALQLHSLRHEAAADPEGVIRRVPSMGFDSVEIAQTYGWSAGQWKAMVTELKLRVVGAHVPLEQLESEWERQIEFQRGIGNSRLVVPALPRDLQTVAGYPEAAARLTVLGLRAISEGFALFYHNHACEFAPLGGGRCGMDVLLGETQPNVLSLEVDTYWVERGGVSSREFIMRNANRVGMLHAKEFCRDGRDVPAGQGDVDWKSIIPLARSRGWPIVVEYEAENPFPAVEASARYLSTL
ncbi:MAG TPA: sugar phosphate isomerase/epimerase [Verrucomicrobiae bacterium]|nr:sugar phosphate isomerase/epimerase [Verrucomicrobiae bacterium]